MEPTASAEDHDANDDAPPFLLACLSNCLGLGARMEGRGEGGKNGCISRMNRFWGRSCPDRVQ